ncbi:energy transducer TonB [Polycyclovorans algicola]|uniref:energy transducer TonB n=1 Tax=Polycyclovorans algicola TaxID=616992 RepID=UPI001268A707|nr:energy transducer TonB [Polycyclovorans algicola]
MSLVAPKKTPPYAHPARPDRRATLWALALHLSPFLITLLVPDLLWGTRDPGPPSVMEVVMLTEEVQAPEPEPETPESEPTPPPTPPPPEEDVIGLEPSPTPTVTPTPTPTPPATPQPTQRPTATPRPKPAAPAAEDGETDAERFASSREKGIFDRVQGRWLLPPGISSSLSCDVRITLNARGEVTDTEITRKSGNDTFDDSVIRAIYKSSPFPVDPEARGDTQTMMMTWDASELL